MNAERQPLTLEQRNAALALLRGMDQTAIVEAAKLLSSDPSTTSALVELLDVERRPEVRQGVLHALAWHADLGTLDLIVRIVGDPQEAPAVRGQAAEALAYMFDRLSPGSDAFVSASAASVAALTDPSPEVRYCAVFALGSSAHLPLLPALESMLVDHTPVPGWGRTVAQYAAEQMDALRRAHTARQGRIPPYE